MDLAKHQAAVTRGVSEAITLAQKFMPKSVADALATGPEKFVGDVTSLAVATSLLVITCKEMEAVGIYQPGDLARVQDQMAEVFAQLKKEMGL